MEQVKNKQLDLGESLPNCYTFFVEGRYGKSIEITNDISAALISLKPLIDVGLCVPYAIGAYIYTRQYIMLMNLRDMALTLLRRSPRSWWTNMQWKKVVQANWDITMNCLMEQEPGEEDPEEETVLSLLSGTYDTRDSLEEHLAILWNEPSVLVHDVNIRLLSRPELVMDDKERWLPHQTDKNINGAIFEAVCSAIERHAIWCYISELLDFWHHLDEKKDTVHTRIVLQEISNICHFEYSRARAHFLRQVQTGIGARCFKRLVNVYDEAGNPKVIMKIKPEELAEDDAHLQYVLRLCHSNESQALEWIKKLDDLYEAHPSSRKDLQEREIDALADLVMITDFIEAMIEFARIPAHSHKTGQAFVAGSRELHSALNDLKKELDLQDFAVPIDKLLKPGMANKALTKIDAFIVRKTGANLEFYYHYIAQESLACVYFQCQRTEVLLNKTEPFAIPVTNTSFISERLERKKARSRYKSPSDIHS
ncbi:hypothetical protein TrVGV298_000898 [Trichoderma virens]|nr:hypothetical protein TrVGV298_000898 [Trichoderma virens]